MAALRNDYAVHTAEASKRKGKKHREAGRPTLPDELRRKFSVRIGLTGREYEALKSFMNAECQTDEAAAARTVLLKRLKDGGFLTD